MLDVRNLREKNDRYDSHKIFECDSRNSIYEDIQ